MSDIVSKQLYDNIIGKINQLPNFQEKKKLIITLILLKIKKIIGLEKLINMK